MSLELDHHKGVRGGALIRKFCFFSADLETETDCLCRYKTKSGWGIDKIVFEEAEDGVTELVYEPLNLRLRRVKH